MMNSVDSLPMILPTEFILSVIPLIKIARHYLFLLYFNYFFPIVFVGKIRRQFSNKNITSVFPFVFIDFLVVINLSNSRPRAKPGSRVGLTIDLSQHNDKNNNYYRFKTRIEG